MAATSTSSSSSQKEGNRGEVIATHYNNLQEKGLEQRSQSRIFHMRNFNNWIKSLLISQYLEKAKIGKKSGSELTVLDICCGKGGDLLKWRIGGVGYLVCADIAEISVDQCRNRYEEMWRRGGDQSSRKFGAEFIVADCTKVRLREKYSQPDIKFDLVSCQFSLHYCFESIGQIETMLLNVSECLRPGGYFIGTIPDANEIVKRLKSVLPDSKFGNEVYSVTFPPPAEEGEGTERKLGLFGAEYSFHLEGVVDCPEFLVYFPLLEEMARKHGLKVVQKSGFDRMCSQLVRGRREDRTRDQEEARRLLGRMQALETYPPFDGQDLLGKALDDYSHAEDTLVKLSKDNPRESPRVGTLSKAEWEAITLYLAFAFQKEEE